MRDYIEICPVCGKVNEHLNLEETGGYYECDRCKTVSKSRIHCVPCVELPLFDLASPEDQKRLIEFCNNTAKAH